MKLRDAAIEDIRFISTREACSLLGCSQSYFYEFYIQGGRVTPVRRGKHNIFLAAQVRSQIIEEAKAAGVFD